MSQLNEGSGQPLSVPTVRYRASYRRCGKPNCSTCRDGKGHGPYWYAHWREGKRVRSRYVGLTRTEPAGQDRVLRIHTLGRFILDMPEGGTVVVKGRVRELFTMLLSSPYGSIGREEIAESLWPDADPLAADQNVRVTVAGLRRQLGVSDYVRVGGAAVILVLPPGSRDDRLFESAAREALATDRLEAMEKALELYCGAYLPDDLYSEWTNYRRQILADLRRELVLTLVRASRGRAVVRVEWLRNLLNDDRTDEMAAEFLVRLLAETGRQAEALRVFRSVVDALRRDLEVEPADSFLHLGTALTDATGSGLGLRTWRLATKPQ